MAYSYYVPHPWVIYLLHNQHGQPDYIGYSLRFKRRLRDHTRSRGYEPQAVILEEGIGEGYNEAEKKWIAHYLATGIKLRNIRSGGGGGAAMYGTRPQWSAAGAEKVAQTQFKAQREMRPEWEEKRLKSVRAWWAEKSPEQRAEMTRARTRKRLESWTAEQKSDFAKRIAAIRHATGSYERSRALRSEKAKRQSASPEARAKIGGWIRKMWADMTPERRAEYIQKLSVAAKEARRQRKSRVPQQLDLPL